MVLYLIRESAMITKFIKKTIFYFLLTSTVSCYGSLSLELKGVEVNNNTNNTNIYRDSMKDTIIPQSNSIDMPTEATPPPKIFKKIPPVQNNQERIQIENLYDQETISDLEYLRNYNLEYQSIPQKKSKKNLKKINERKDLHVYFAEYYLRNSKYIFTNYPFFQKNSDICKGTFSVCFTSKYIRKDLYDYSKNNCINYNKSVEEICENVKIIE